MCSFRLSPKIFERMDKINMVLGDRGEKPLSQSEIIERSLEVFEQEASKCEGEKAK